ncbi:MAG: metalloregulator ArsR/SmtB family transcription factor [Actinomycetota bacterium]|nr:metalloregulator ArsR/SmtB family transcription factor [Actinomycetota bacterium]
MSEGTASSAPRGRRAAKDQLFEGLASVAKALSSGRRAEIVELLSQGERSVEEIADCIGQSVANTSHHLRSLARAGLVDSRREGTYVLYRLASARVSELWRAVRDVAAEHIGDIRELAAAYLGDSHEVETVSRYELAGRLRRDEVVVIDVRPEAEFRAGHITGAISLPVPELVRRLDELPDDAEVVAYCRGPYCVFADDAVRTLNRLGRRAYRLEDGYPEWSQAGLPVATGDAARPERLSAPS